MQFILKPFRRPFHMVRGFVRLQIDVLLGVRIKQMSLLYFNLVALFVVSFENCLALLFLFFLVLSLVVVISFE